MADKFYISTCPDTGRVFICESGIDNNIAEVFAQNNKTVADNARLVCGALNSDLVISGGKVMRGREDGRRGVQLQNRSRGPQTRRLEKEQPDEQERRERRRSVSVCSKWSREYGCRCCGDRDACHELGIDPLENATDAELEALDLEPRDKKHSA